MIGSMHDGYFTITAGLLQELSDRQIYLKRNAPPPVEGRYGWLSEGQRIRLHHRVRIEEHVGLYVGRYRPMVGGQYGSGLCSIGAYSYSYSALPDGLTVGRYGSISRGLSFIDSFHPMDRLTTSALMFRPANTLFGSAVTPAIREYAKSFAVGGSEPYPTIGHDVWIGGGVTLAMGIQVGHGAVIAANSTVTKDVPAYAVVAGNPARVVKRRFSEELVARLLASRWWDYDPAQLFETTDLELSLSWIEDGKLDRKTFSSIILPDARRPSDLG